MQKFSGLVLDPYDDAAGNVWRDIFPDLTAVPEHIKEARALTPAERASLPPSAFALELVNDGAVLRKFACVDRGNTEASCLFFVKTAHKLPLEAQKVAGQRLLSACEGFGVTPPAGLQKIALGLGGLLALATVPSTVKGTTGQIKRNRAVAQMSGDMVNPAVLGGM